MSSSVFEHNVEHLSTRFLKGKRVFYCDKQGREHRVGKVHMCVFHPEKPLVMGLLVRRPDLAFMVHRSDIFVWRDAFSIEDGRIKLSSDRLRWGKKALKQAPPSGDVCEDDAAPIDYEKCVLWEGMPLITRNGQNIGSVGDVLFSVNTGRVIQVVATQGAGTDALIGTRTIPANLLVGFRFGKGARLRDSAASNQSLTQNGSSDTELLGAIMIDDAAEQLEEAGGAAVALGTGVGKVQQRVVQNVKDITPPLQDATKTVAREATKAAYKGAQATQQQLKRAKGMFAAFKEEYDKASRD